MRATRLSRPGAHGVYATPLQRASAKPTSVTRVTVVHGDAETAFVQSLETWTIRHDARRQLGRADAEFGQHESNQTQTVRQHGLLTVVDVPVALEPGDITVRIS